MINVSRKLAAAVTAVLNAAGALATLKSQIRLISIASSFEFTPTCSYLIPFPSLLDLDHAVDGAQHLHQRRRGRNIFRPASETAHNFGIIRYSGAFFELSEIRVLQGV